LRKGSLDERGEGLKGRTVRGDPAPGGNVGNRHAVADEVARGGLGQLRVQDGVQAARLVGVAVDAVLDLFRGVSYKYPRQHSFTHSLAHDPSLSVENKKLTVKVICLSLHRPQATHLPMKLQVTHVSK
jgi:hypothetical protein